MDHTNTNTNTTAPTARPAGSRFRPLAVTVAVLASLLLAVGALAACSKIGASDAPATSGPKVVVSEAQGDAGTKSAPTSSASSSTSRGSKTSKSSSSIGDCSSSATCPDGRDKTGKKSSERGFGR